MKTKFFLIIFILSNKFIFSSNFEIFYTTARVHTTFYDSSVNVLYAAGSDQMLKFQGNSWSYFSPAPPFSVIRAITKYNNQIYIGGDFGVARFDGTEWILLPPTNIVNPIYELFVYQNKLYAFNTDYLQTNLTMWDGNQWSEVDPGLSTIGCAGISTMFTFNNELYANSAFTNGASVIIKKSGDTWTFPNGTQFNMCLRSHCVFNNKLYLANNERVSEFDGVSWRYLDFFLTNTGSYSFGIQSLRTDGLSLYISGDFNWLVNSQNQIDVKNIITWSGDNLILPIESGLTDPIWDFNFYNSKLYAFGWSWNVESPVSVIDSIYVSIPEPNISIRDTSVCQGERLGISEISNTGFKWRWEIDETPPIIDTTREISLFCHTPGFHTIKIKVSNPAGDSTRIYANIIHVLENPAKPTILIVGDTLFSSSSSNNQWFLNGDSLPDTANYIIFPLTAHTYVQVAVRNESGCMSFSDYIVNIEENNPVESIKVFPNPNNGIMTLENKTEAFTEYRLSVETIQGREILSKSIVFSNSYKLDLTGFPEGIYFLIMQNDKKRMALKVVVQR
jgi:hypothetical protein